MEMRGRTFLTIVFLKQEGALAIREFFVCMYEQICNGQGTSFLVSLARIHRSAIWFPSENLAIDTDLNASASITSFSFDTFVHSVRPTLVVLSRAVRQGIASRKKQMLICSHRWASMRWHNTGVVTRSSSLSLISVLHKYSTSLREIMLVNEVDDHGSLHGSDCMGWYVKCLVP